MKVGLLAFFTGVVVTAVLVLAFGSRLWRLAAIASANGGGEKVTYTDFLTVTLTALCALLAAMAIAIGIAAIVGYHDLKTSAEKIATEKAETAAAERASTVIEQWTSRFTSIEQEMRSRTNMMAKLQQDLFTSFSQEHAARLGVAKASKSKQNGPKKSVPPQYPKKGS